MPRVKRYVVYDLKKTYYYSNKAKAISFAKSLSRIRKFVGIRDAGSNMKQILILKNPKPKKIKGY
tara:strand:+ start:486 stop:680 length:195 start_codon:yes stop_codon:yes gene_type:complete